MQDISLSDYCSDAIGSFNQSYGSQQILQKLNSLQICLRTIVCPGFHCQTVNLSRNSMNRTTFSCNRILNDVLHTNFKHHRKDFAYLQNIAKSVHLCQQRKQPQKQSTTEMPINEEKRSYSSTQRSTQANKISHSNTETSIQNHTVYSMYNTFSATTITSFDYNYFIAPTNQPDVLSLLENSEIAISNEDSVTSHSTENSLEPIAFLAGAASGIFVSLGSFAGSVASAVLSVLGSAAGIGTALSSISVSNTNPNDPSQMNGNDENNMSVEKDSTENESTEDDSEEKSEYTTTAKSTTTTTTKTTTESMTTHFSSTSSKQTTITTTKYATTTEASTTTEEWSTTTSQPEFCWLEPLVPNNSTKKRRQSRSPTNRLLPESQYPGFPLGLCRLNINELNSHHDDKTSYEFIELIRQCKEGGRRSEVAKKHLINIW